MERCYDAVRADPTRPIGEIYKAVRSDMTKDMTPEEKETFMEDIPEKIQLVLDYMIIGKISFPRDQLIL